MHTPGPWRDGGCGRIILNGSNCYMVQEIWNGQGGFNPDDIRLMAAGPELLDALRDIVACVSMNSPIGTRAYLISDGRMDAARAAIAKATGHTEVQHVGSQDDDEVSGDV